MNNQSYQRGDVVYAEAIYKNNRKGTDQNRPWLIISNPSIPCRGQYLAMSITTNGRRRSIPISNQYWKHGGLSKQSFVNPWSTRSLQKDDILGKPGTLTDGFVDEVVDQLNNYLTG